MTNRIAELAAELGIEPKVVVDRAWALGIAASGAGHELEPAMEAALRQALAISPPAPPASESGEEAEERGAKAIRIYELAAELGVPTRVMVDYARDVGVPVADHLSRLSGEPLRKLRAALAHTPPDVVVEERLGTNLKKRRKLRPQ